MVPRRTSLPRREIPSIIQENLAIANSRLDRLDDDGTVSFHYRDNRTRQLKTATVSAEEFLTRFLAHVLPEGFTKVRYSGLFSSCNRHRLEAARALLAPPTNATPVATSQTCAADGIAADSPQKRGARPGSLSATARSVVSS